MMKSESKSHQLQSDAMSIDNETRHEETVQDEERAENYTFAFSSSSSSYCSGFLLSTLSEM